MYVTVLKAEGYGWQIDAYQTIDEVVKALSHALHAARTGKSFQDDSGASFLPIANCFAHAETAPAGTKSNPVALLMYVDPTSGEAPSGKKVGEVFIEFKDVASPLCHVCGEEFALDATEVAYHVDEDAPDGRDYDADADHVPYAVRDFGYVSSLVVEPHGTQNEARVFVLDA